MPEYNFDSLLGTTAETTADTIADTTSDMPALVPDAEKQQDRVQKQAVDQEQKYDFDALFADQEREESIQIERSLINANQVDPDRRAKAIELGDKFGVEHGAAEQNLEELQRRENDAKKRQILDNTPVLNGWMRNQENAEVAHDDLENLSLFEKSLDSLRSLFAGFTTLPQGAQGLGRAYWGFSRSLVDVISDISPYPEATRDFLRTPLPDVFKYLEPGHVLQKIGEGWGEIGDVIRPERERMGLHTEVSEALGQMAAQIGMTMAPGGGYAVSTTLFGGMGYNIAYERAKASGASENQANNAGMLGAMATTVSERLGIDVLLRRVPPAIRNRWVRGISDVAMAGGIEAFEEYAEGVLHNMIAAGIYDPDAEIWTTSGHEERAAGIAAGIVRTILHGVSKGRTLETPTEREGRQQAEVEKMVKAAVDSKLRARSVEKFKEFVATVKEESGVENILIPTDKFMEYFQEAAPGSLKQIVENIPSISEQLVDPAAADGNISIPLEDYAAYVAGTEHHAGLAPNIKLREDILSESEQEAKNEQIEASADQIQQDVAKQLEAAGMAPDVAMDQAMLHREYFKTMAKYFDVDPMDVYNQTGLSIERGGDELALGVGSDQLGQMLDEIRTEQSGEQSEVVEGTQLDMLETMEQPPAEYQSAKAKLNDWLQGQGIDLAQMTNEEVAAQIEDTQQQGMFQSAPPVESEAFKIWFGDSKVVDESGEPLVVYHGTDADISEFSREFAKEGPSKFGFWFTNQQGFAEFFGDKQMPLYVSIKNPHIITKEQWNQIRDEHAQDGEWFENWNAQLQKQGHDGLIVKGDTVQIGSTTVIEPDVYSVFDPTQIKSVKNVGTFDPNDPRIMYQDKHGKINFLGDQTVIKLFQNADMSTFLHESGHLFLETTARLAQSENAPEIVRKDYATILDYLGAKPGDTLTTEQHEQFARSFESYLREGKAPSQELQGPFQRFREWLLSIYKSVKQLDVTINDEIRGVFDRMLAGEDAGKTAQERQGGLPSNAIRSSLNERLDAFRFQMQDKLIDLKRVQEEIGQEIITDDMDAYQKAAIWEGRAGERLNDFDETRVQPLLEQVADSGLTLDEVGEWLVARHAEEANAYLAEINPDMQGEERFRLSGMSNSEAQEILNKHKGNEKLQQIGLVVDQINRERVILLVQNGLISQEEANAWQGRYKHYVPLKRAEAEQMDLLPSRGQGFHMKGRESKKRTGSAYWTPTQIVTNTLAQAESSIVRAEKNRVGQALLRMVEENPDDNFWRIAVDRTIRSVRQPTDAGQGKVVETTQKPEQMDAPNQLTVKRDGETFVIEFERSNEKAMRMVSGLKNLQAPQMAGAMRLLGTVNRFLSQVNTSWDPEFIISNFARDIQTATYNLSDTEINGMATRMVKDVPKAMNGIRSGLFGDGTAEWASVWEDFRKAGGKTGWIDIHQNLSEKEEELKKMAERIGKGKPTKALMTRFLDKIDDLNAVVENGVRLSAYKNALDAGLSKDKAAALAKDLTVNFNRKGNMGPTMNALYMFYNASIQGQVRLLQAMTRSKKGRRLAAATIGFAVMLDILNRSLAGEDDDGENLYDTLPDYVKDHNFIIMGENGPIVKIPLPWGYNVLHTLGQTIGQSVAGKRFDPLASAARIGNSAIDAFNPVGSGTITQTIAPTIADPLVMMAENKNFAGIPLKPEHTFDVATPKPEYLMHWKSARETSKDVAKWLNDVSGGSSIRPGDINVSPEWIDLLIDMFTGGIGRNVGNVSDVVERMVEGKEIPTKNVPFLRRLTGFDYEYGVKARYYEWSRDVAYAKAEIKKLRGQDRVEARKRPAAKLIQLYNNTQKKLRMLRKQRRAIKEDDQDRIEAVDVRIRKAMAKFNSQYAERVLDAE